MKGLGLHVLGAVFLAGMLALPASADTANLPTPGTVNYVEGQASIGAQPLNSKAVGSVELQRGQTLTTQDGRAEIYLTPDVLLRVGSHSSVKMISPSLTDTEIAVEHGDAQVEVDHYFKQNKLRVQEGGATARLQKKGLYDFNANQDEVRVLKGQALLRSGDHQVKVDSYHQVALNSATLKPQKFNQKTFEANNGLYRWGKLRNEYVTEANNAQQEAYWGPAWAWGPGWGWGWGPGWMWGPGWWW
jgi:hypothetical protein